MCLMGGNGSEWCLDSVEDGDEGKEEEAGSGRAEIQPRPVCLLPLSIATPSLSATQCPISLPRPSCSLLGRASRPEERGFLGGLAMATSSAGSARQLPKEQAAGHELPSQSARPSLRNQDT